MPIYVFVRPLALGIRIQLPVTTYLVYKMFFVPTFHSITGKCWSGISTNVFEFYFNTDLAQNLHGDFHLGPKQPPSAHILSTFWEKQWLSPKSPYGGSFSRNAPYWILPLEIFVHPSCYVPCIWLKLGLMVDLYNT